MSTNSWANILASEDITFTPPRRYPQSKEKAGVKLRVICVGLPRTGTTSLAAALEIVGLGPVLHDHGGRVDEFIRLVKAKTEQLEYPEEKLQTADATSEKQSPEDAAHAEVQNNLKVLEDESGVSLTSLTNGYAAILDCPGMDFYQELMSLHPDALVILTTRDSPSAWWKSYYETMGYLVDPGWKGFFWRVFIWPIRENTHELGEAVTRLWCARYGGWGWGLYEMHDRDVKAFVPEGKLLVWNVKEGWPRLCQFLDVKVPQREFPRLNDAKSMRASVGKRYLEAVVTWGLVFGAICWLIFLDFISDGYLFELWVCLRSFFEFVADTTLVKMLLRL